jgi:GntR family transcriptional regulator, transcriptional repressor for pyruvate dehydrogenase complex
LNVIFEPIDTQTIRMKVVEQIVKMIKEGKLSPGSQLPSERAIAEQMGISRPTVREAVAALEVVGLVETRSGQGTFVKGGDIESLKVRAEALFVEERSPFETLETRKIVETHAAGLAAERATEAQIAEIERNFQGLTIGDSQEWSYASDLQFHTAIAKASGNSILADLSILLIRMNHQKVWEKLKEIGRLEPGSLERDLHHHRDILQAIKERNPEKAKEAVWCHFTSVEKDLFDA